MPANEMKFSKTLNTDHQICIYLDTRYSRVTLGDVRDESAPIIVK
jgi:hypothetical protein